MFVKSNLILNPAVETAATQIKPACAGLILLITMSGVVALAKRLRRRYYIRRILLKHPLNFEIISPLV